MTPEIEAAIRVVQEANRKADAAAFNMQEAEKVLAACHVEADETNKARMEAERALVKLVRGGVV